MYGGEIIEDGGEKAGGSQVAKLAMSPKLVTLALPCWYLKDILQYSEERKIITGVKESTLFTTIHLINSGGCLMFSVPLSKAS